MTNQQEIEILAMCAEFFQESLQFNLTLYTIAKWAFILAIVLIVINALVAVWKALQTPSPKDGGVVLASVTGPPSVTDLLKAFPALIDSLAKAPAAIVLIILGLLLVWVPTVDTPGICEEPLSQSIGKNDTALENAGSTGATS